MIQGVRRKAGKLSGEEVKETSIISNLHTAATKRPHLFGVFAVSIVVIALVLVFLSQKDPVPRASQPKLAASTPAASNSGDRKQTFAATPDPQYPDKSKITKLTLLEKEVIQKNRSDRELEQKRTPPSRVAPAPTPSETARSTKSSNNAHTNASSKPSHPINTQISKIERSSISSNKDQTNASATPSHPLHIETANQSENLRPASLELAREALKKKNFGRAVELLRVALAQESTRDVPHVKSLYSRALRGQAGMFMGTDANRAEILLREAVEIEPQNSEAYFDLGKLYTQSKDFPKAIKSYQKAISLNSRSAKTFYNLGFIYATTQDYTNAEEMFLRAAELKPSFLDKTIFNLAMVQQKQGKKEECVNNLEKALNINPDNHRARKYFERLTGITGESR
jgi:Tfp pilus assembly protein PilF